MHSILFTFFNSCKPIIEVQENDQTLVLYYVIVYHITVVSDTRKMEVIVAIYVYVRIGMIITSLSDLVHRVMAFNYSDLLSIVGG